MKRARNKHNKVLKVVIMSLCPLLAVYLGISMFFIKHFYFGSTINNINVAGKTVQQADSQIAQGIDNYTLKIKGRNNEFEEIKGRDINLKYDSKGKIEELKSKQNPFLWLVSVFNKDDVEINELVDYDTHLLKEKVNEISKIHDSNVIEPENPQFKYSSGGYSIVPEVKGNKLNKDLVFEAVKKAVDNGVDEIDLDKEGCYEQPKYTKDSEEVKSAREQLDNYTKIKLTYNFKGDFEEVIDGSNISEWLEVDNNMNVTLNDALVRNYVESLARKYNTYGATRKFHTTSGNVIDVSGGNYGWIVDKSAQTKDIIEAIREGKDDTREPKYSQTAVNAGSDDIGSTYVEIDMTKQHLWYYKDGSLITEGDVVTGNASLNYSTPVGTYRLNYKEKNATLKGEDYSSKVNYWMPFNNNIGIHDASWRDTFGGQIYLTNGSHGCVNAPYEVAEKIFQNIESGTPIICYYES